jgi:hypothetical protein
MSDHAAKGDAFLHEEWRELRNGAGEIEMVHFGGMIRALHAVGLLSDDQRELWGRRSHTCPGHDDEGGRDWCAYCGLMPRDPGTVADDARQDAMAAAVAAEGGVAVEPDEGTPF